MIAYYVGNYGFEIELTEEEANIGSHIGQCDEDIEYLLNTDHIREQLNNIPADIIANELREYGAWDEEELKNEDKNKARILWIACGDVLTGIGQ